MKTHNTNSRPVNEGWIDSLLRRPVKDEHGEMSRSVYKKYDELENLHPSRWDTLLRLADELGKTKQKIRDIRTAISNPSKQLWTPDKRKPGDGASDYYRRAEQLKEAFNDIVSSCEKTQRIMSEWEKIAQSVKSTRGFAFAANGSDYKYAWRALLLAEEREKKVGRGERQVQNLVDSLFALAAASKAFEKELHAEIVKAKNELSKIDNTAIGGKMNRQVGESKFLHEIHRQLVREGTKNYRKT